MYLEGIETDRMKFRALVHSDILLWERFFNNNPNLNYQGLDPSLDAKAQSIEWIEIQLKRYKENRFGHHAIIDKKTEEFIGQCGLLKQEIEGKEEIEIGYHILPEYWGKGYATEAALAVKNYAIKNRICKSLISVIDIRSKGSQNVASKLGMKIDKEMQMFDLDVYIYRIKI